MYLHYGFVHPIELSFCGGCLQNKIFNKLLYGVANTKFEDYDKVRITNRPTSREDLVKCSVGCMEGAPNFLRLTADRDGILNRWL